MHNHTTTASKFKALLIVLTIIVTLTSCNEHSEEVKPLVFGVWQVEHRKEGNMFTKVNDSLYIYDRVNMFFVYDKQFNQYKPLKINNKVQFNK